MTRAFRPFAKGTVQLTLPEVTVAEISLHIVTAKPPPESETLPVSATLVAVVVPPFVGESRVTCGAVVSRLIVSAADAVLPAASVAVLWIIWPLPSVETSTGAGQLVPSLLSEQLKVIVTGVLFQPAAFGAGQTLAEIVGAVVSTVYAELSAELCVQSGRKERAFTVTVPLVTCNGAVYKLDVAVGSLPSRVYLTAAPEGPDNDTDCASAYTPSAGDAVGAAKVP
jgi:hypothetical protein